nr:immunoglobulin heavy chain junction region [Mus musculus]MBK4188255.1 immunoglobulin heavy chain junction region [Mus musculus]MBK4188258.1 immunoglobulin heavy chain junction region [Mus musculus]MBK4188259.1 immunoglobulin heavy chain junction region [Mus musculus]MBK4188260.1 immunoglobulin heavy chain junction region [Mus musculus]
CARTHMTTVEDYAMDYW